MLKKNIPGAILVCLILFTFVGIGLYLGISIDWDPYSGCIEATRITNASPPVSFLLQLNTSSTESQQAYPQLIIVKRSMRST